MATKVLVPRLGEGVDEVTITKWLKKEGDSVKELEPLLEVNTDKVDTEIPAPASGVILKIEMQEGQPAKVGQLLALIGVAGESASVSSAPVPSAPAKAESKEPSNVERSTFKAEPATRSADLGFISPVVAKIATERGIDLSQVPGTGLNGRITKNDVLNFVQTPPAKETYHAPRTTQHATPIVTPSAGDTLIKHTLIRKQIADHMVMSKSVSPHVLTVMEADMSKVAKHRAANKAAFERDGANLTFTAYFMMSIVAGLKAYPNTNSSWTDEGLLIDTLGQTVFDYSGLPEVIDSSGSREMKCQLSWTPYSWSDTASVMNTECCLLTGKWYQSTGYYPYGDCPDFCTASQDYFLVRGVGVVEYKYYKLCDPYNYQYKLLRFYVKH